MSHKAPIPDGLIRGGTVVGTRPDLRRPSLSPLRGSEDKGPLEREHVLGGQIPPKCGGLVLKTGKKINNPIFIEAYEAYNEAYLK